MDGKRFSKTYFHTLGTTITTTTTATTITTTTTTATIITTTTTATTITTTTTATTITTTTMTITTTPVFDSTSLWSFENNNQDSLSSFHGVPRNSSTCRTPGINGYGFALSLDQGNSQFVEVLPYRPLYDRSFTVEMWFYCTDLVNNNRYGLFSQHDSHNTRKCLHYQIRNNHVALAFYSNDLEGSTPIQINT